uniref:G-protein coupled receptors family 1 profile domain-containing protein n=1 Tax=Chrysemys picta bellii TaxID=8478 RepID=A0A8C3ICJ5_CHRPI
MWVLVSSMHVVSMVIYSITFVLGVTGNGLVIFITALGFHWPFGRALCKINTTLAFLNLYASVYLLMVISIDRCISVVRPVWAQNHRTPKLAFLVALGVWVVALALCSPNLYFRHTAPSPYNENITNCYNNFDMAGEGATEDQRARSVNTNHRVMIISRFILGFKIPFSVIVCCYGAILAKLKRNQLARSGKPFKVIAAVIVAFVLCWFPYHIFSFLEMNRTPSLDTALIVGLPLTASLAFINSCPNPILYVFMAFESAFSEEAVRTTLGLGVELQERERRRQR